MPLIPQVKTTFVFRNVYNQDGRVFWKASTRISRYLQDQAVKNQGWIWFLFIFLPSIQFKCDLIWTRETRIPPFISFIAVSVRELRSLCEVSARKMNISTFYLICFRPNSTDTWRKLRQNWHVGWTPCLLIRFWWLLLTRFFNFIYFAKTLKSTKSSGFYQIFRHERKIDGRDCFLLRLECSKFCQNFSCYYITGDSLRNNWITFNNNSYFQSQLCTLPEANTTNTPTSRSSSKTPTTTEIVHTERSSSANYNNSLNSDVDMKPTLVLSCSEVKLRNPIAWSFPLHF